MGQVFDKQHIRSEINLSQTRWVESVNFFNFASAEAPPVCFYLLSDVFPIFFGSERRTLATSSNVEFVKQLSFSFQHVKKARETY